MKKISIIIPVKNEERYIAACLESVLNNDYPKELMEIFIVDGLSNDMTIDIIKRYLTQYNNIKLLSNNNETVPYALNMAIKKSSGEYIIRLDAHTSIPRNYFSELIKLSEEFNADDIGTCCITDIKNSNSKTNAIKKVLSNKFGVGDSYFRIGISTPKEVDHVPFGCYKREIFNKVGLFNQKLTRNQDIEFSKRIKKSGGRIILIPNVQSTYYARESFFEIYKNNFANGKWNILTVYITKKLSSLSLRHFIPIIFLLSIIIPLIGMIFNPIIGLISLLSLMSYLSLISFISFKLKDKTTSFIYIFISFLVLHFSYAFGSLLGLLRSDYLFKEHELFSKI